MKTKAWWIFALLLGLGFGFWRIQQNSEPQANPPTIPQKPAPPQTPTPAPMAAAKLSPNLKISNQRDLMDRYPGDWNIEEINGRLRIAGGVPIPIRGDDPAERRRLVESLALFLGVNSQNLVSRSHPNGTSALSSVYFFDHEIDGVPVFDSYLSLTVRSEDQAVILISSQLKFISDYNPDIRFDQAHAERLVQSWNQFERLIQIDLIVYASPDGHAVKAWKAIYQHAGGKQSVALISGQNGVVLMQRPAQSH